MQVWPCRGSATALVPNHLAFVHILPHLDDEMIKMPVNCGNVIPMIDLDCPA
jgi:hypothetical protein